MAGGGFVSEKKFVGRIWRVKERCAFFIIIGPAGFNSCSLPIRQYHIPTGQTKPVVRWPLGVMRRAEQPKNSCGAASEAITFISSKPPHNSGLN
jgi:hypothetical protein